MTAIDALHGRARMRRARRLRLAIVLLALAPILVLALEQLARIDAGLAVGTRWLGSAPAGVVAAIASCLGGAIGGLLIDRLGLKAVVGLLLVGWCGLAVLGAISDPMVYLGLTRLVTSLLPGTVLVAVLVAPRLALAPRRRGLAVAFLVTVYFAIYTDHAPFGLFTLLFDRPDPEAPASWQYPMFALATAGAGLTALWLLAFPEVDAASGLDLRPPPRRQPAVMVEDAVRLLGDPAVLSLLAIQLCGTFVGVYALNENWSLELIREGAVGTTSLIAMAATPVAFLVMAGWSDWVYRRTRSFLKARRPFVVAGFLLAAFAPPAAVAFPRHEIAFTLLAAIGVGAMRVGDLIVVDLAPRRSAGAFIGMLVASETALTIAVNTLYFVATGRARIGETFVICLAIAGAALAAVLMPLMQPEDDVRRDRDEGIAGHF